MHSPGLLTEPPLAGTLRRATTVALAREPSPWRWPDLDANLHPHEPLLATIWRLRDNLTASDAAYVALALALDAPLVTLDARLASAPHGATVELVR